MLSGNQKATPKKVFIWYLTFSNKEKGGLDTLEFRIRHSRNRYVKGINYCWTFFMYWSLESERKPSLKGDIFYEVKCCIIQGHRKVCISRWGRGKIQKRPFLTLKLAGGDSAHRCWKRSSIFQTSHPSKKSMLPKANDLRKKKTICQIFHQKKIRKFWWKLKK